MREADPASHGLENSPRPGAGGPEGSLAPRSPAAPGEGGAGDPSPAASDPFPAPRLSGPGPAEKFHSRPVVRPVTIGQLQRILEMRLGFTVSQNTLEGWCRNRKIRAYRLGAAWRIPRDEVERILRSAQAGESF
jgi:excisionase family DNA binding protein